MGFGFGLVCGIAALGNLAVTIARKRAPRGQNQRSPSKDGCPWRAIRSRCILDWISFRYSLVAYVGTMKRVVIPMTIVLAYMLLKEREVIQAEDRWRNHYDYRGDNYRTRLTGRKHGLTRDWPPSFIRVFKILKTVMTNPAPFWRRVCF